MLSILVLILVLWILIQTTFFQTFLIHRVASRLSSNLNTTVSIKKIDLELFDKMSLQDLLVLDRKKDTLLYAGAAKVSLTDWFFFKKRITLKYIGLDDALINLHRSDSVWNYQFLIDYFSGPTKKKKDTSSNTIDLDLKVLNLKNIRIWQKDEWRGENILASINKLIVHADKFDPKNRVIGINEIKLEHPTFSLFDYAGKRPIDTTTLTKKTIAETKGLQWNPDAWRLSIKNISISDGFVAIESEGKATTEKRFDESHIILSDIQGNLKNSRLINDTLQSAVSLSLKDRGGFIVKKLKADFKFTPKLMEFRNLDIVTNHSHLTDYYAMHYNQFNDDMQDFIHNVTIDGKFKNSVVSSEDLAYFAPETKTWKTVFSLNGNAHGKIDNITGQKMIIRAGEQNYLDGDISLRGLPNIDQTFIDFRSRELRTNYKEISRLIPALKEITNPDLSAMGNIRFNGSYTGYIRDFVTYGTLTTDIGTLQTDLHLRVPPKGKATYNGKVSTTNFQLGKFIGNSQIGDIVFDGKINGKGFDAADVDLGVDGMINKIEFNGYAYTNIITHGTFKNKLFSGTGSINDPHVVIDTLIGTINFSKANPQFNFEANVTKLHLKSLRFTNDSISLKGKFRLNFTGNNIDNFLGSAKLYNAVLKDNGKQLSFDSLKIDASFVDGKKLLTIETNELYASINGTFNISELPNAFQLFLNKYYPAYIKMPKKNLENQNFSFLINTKNISEYINLFDTRITGLDNSIIHGDINIAANILNLKADIPQFNYSNISFNSVHLTGTGTKDTLVLKGYIDDVVINDSLHSPNAKLSVIATKDISDIAIHVTGDRTLSDADISARVLTNKNGFRLTFNPSTFILNQKQWQVEKNGVLELNKKNLTANNIRFSQNGQEIYISTQPSISDSSNDIIIALQNLVIEDVTPFVLKTPKLAGLLNGNIRVNDPFGNMGVEFDTKIEAFRFEDDSVGVLIASGVYLSIPGDLKVNMISNNNLYNFFGDFNYRFKDSSTNQLSGSIVFNNSEIHLLENYLGDIFSNIYGKATGKLSISGKASAPKLTGSVRLDKTALTVDYTQCRYTLKDSSVITFNPDEINFGVLKIIDTLHHTATLTGKIYHTFFDNFFFNDLHLRTDPMGNRPAKFTLLNTTARDNTEFYGHVVGQADLSMNGFITDMTLNISGEPTDSSHIYLPTGETAETGSMDYLEFIKFGREMTADLRARENTNIKVDMELTANPLVKIDVILDETTGDVIKAQGSGKLNITAGTKDPLSIRGRYDIEQGQYTFNFQTFLKTPFTLQQGYIEWQGDPYLANMNIDAIYRAENVNLNNIPTSTGYRNINGDVDIIFKLRGTLKSPQPEFEFQFPFDNPLKSDPIASEFLKTRYQEDKTALMNQVASLLLFNQFMNTDQGLLTGNNTGNFVTRSVGQLLSSTLSSSLNSWLQKVLNTNTVNLITNINTADFNFQKGATQKELQNVGNFGVKTAFLNNKLLVTVAGNVDYRLGQAVTTSNSNFLFTPDVSFEYLISPDGRLRVIGFNRSDADIGDIAGVTRRNRTGVQLSYRKDFDTFAEFFTNEKRQRRTGK
ncbi:MAG: translocation/assembly module TamB domain-containing protein [Ginsengibacter sp.]